MLSVIFSVLMIISVISAFITGRFDELSEAVLNEPVNAVELCIYLCGGMCFWGGIMRVAEKSGITEGLTKLFSVLLGGLFKGLDKNGRAFRAICMNITANMLGLGNAATPLGIEAMKAIAEEEKAESTATPSMVIFTVMNTASVTLIPSTALSMRMKYGSESPLEIVIPVWITSAAALAVSLTAAILPYTGSRQIKKEKRQK
ncbi:MAG: hypothetical protein J6A37_04555 [Oscillospiraceae bacterium]|nr:hypothetical protein [Oscillospiraceae bacterium]